MPPPHPAARASRRASASAVQRCKPGPTRGTSRGRRGGVRVRGAPAVAVRRRTRGTRTSQPPAVVRPFPGTRPHCMAPRGVATRQPQAPGPAPSLSLLRRPWRANGADRRACCGRAPGPDRREANVTEERKEKGGCDVNWLVQSVPGAGLNGRGRAPWRRRPCGCGSYLTSPTDAIGACRFCRRPAPGLLAVRLDELSARPTGASPCRSCNRLVEPRSVAYLPLPFHESGGSRPEILRRVRAP